MKAFYLIVFGLGLALAVHSMLHGISRWKHRKSGRPSAFLNPPVVAAFLASCGAAGYLLVTRSTLATGWALLISLAAGTAALVGMIILLAKWALREVAGTNDTDEEIHGQVATVSKRIPADASGEITYFAWGKMHVLPARSSDGSPIEEGTEVVIDVVDNGIATIELWSVVEQRL